ncbi:MAG: protein kinase [Planctomycetota bacterium]
MTPNEPGDSTSASPPDVQTLFERAIELLGGEREKYLSDACGDDLDVRREVEALLAAYESAGAFLTAPDRLDDETDGDIAAITEGPGATIGRYRLLEQIGEGGFGVVFMAEQERPVRRRVALKIIKLGMDTKQVIARFEAERQALALMDHPNISRVLDAGATETGRPYFVMELVRGEPITKHCDSKKLPVRQRLELFCQVASAIQHAHQKGIIHRDIKPSNVLVTTSGDRPIPKVIDFGIAKAMHFRLTERTLFTGFRQMVGTPAYMSPEQAESSSVEPDTRSDVYSLGVMLYELLVGSPPLDPHTLKDAEYGEMQRLIREADVPAPSTRFSTLGTAERIADERQLEAKRLGLLLKGDLDWIVLKALEKDRARRYQSVGALVEDLNRYLTGETVTARPPSRLYRLQKFISRNRGAVGTAAVVVVAITLGLVGTSLGLVRAVDEKNQRQAALEAERVSRRQAEQLVGLLTDAFESPDPANAGRTVTVLEVLENARRELLSQQLDDEAAQARLMLSLGQTYAAAGEPERAIELIEPARAMLRRSETAEPFESIRATLSMATVLGRLDQIARGLDEVDRAGRDLANIKRPPRNVTGDQRLQWNIQRVELEAEFQFRRAELLLANNQPTETLEALDEIAQNTRGLSGELTVQVSTLRGRALRERGDLDQAVEALHSAASTSQSRLGDVHPLTIEAEIELAKALIALNGGTTPGPENLTPLDMLGDVYDRCVTRFGRQHPRTLSVGAELLVAAADVEDSASVPERLDPEFASRIYDAAAETLPSSHPDRRRIAVSAQAILRNGGREDLASAIRSSESAAASVGDMIGGLTSFEEAYFLGRELVNVGDLERAIVVFERALQLDGETAPNSFRWHDLRFRLIDAQLRLGRVSRAIDIADDLVETSTPPNDVVLTRLLERLSKVLQACADDGSASLKQRGQDVLAAIVGAAPRLFQEATELAGREELTRLAGAANGLDQLPTMTRLLLERRRAYLIGPGRSADELAELRAIERVESAGMFGQGVPTGGMRFDGTGSSLMIPTLHLHAQRPLVIEAIITPVNSGRASAQTYTCIVGANESAGLALAIQHRGIRSLISMDFHVGGSDPRTSSYGYVNSRSPNNVVSGQRIHVAGVWTGATLDLYVDGELVSSVPDVSRQGLIANLPVIVGAGPSRTRGIHQFFNGVIEAVRVREMAGPDDVPTKAEALDLVDGTVVLFDLTERTGGLVPDRSGNGFHGVATAVEWVPTR